MDVPAIPMMGDKGLPQGIQPHQVASWIEPDDKIPILLAISLYTTPRLNLGKFMFLPETLNPKRAGAWINDEGIAVIGFAGTDPTDSKDVTDDQVSRFIQAFSFYHSQSHPLAGSRHQQH